MILPWIAGGAAGSLASGLLLRETRTRLVRGIFIGTAASVAAGLLSSTASWVLAFAAAVFIGVVAVQTRFAFSDRDAP